MKKKRKRVTPAHERSRRWLENEQQWMRRLEEEKARARATLMIEKENHQTLLDLHDALAAENRLYKATVAEMEVYHEEALRKLQHAHIKTRELAIMPAPRCGATSPTGLRCKLAVGHGEKMHTGSRPNYGERATEFWT